jgi:fatty acid-binding protein DegV
MHTDAPEKAAALQEISSRAFLEEKIPISDMNPMFGIHVGPGAFGLGYMFE